MQGNLANTHRVLGLHEQALRLKEDVYAGWLKLKGEENADTLREASNLAHSLVSLLRFDEAKALLRRMMPVARRAIGPSHITTLRMRLVYSVAIYTNADATLDDLRDAVSTLEETERIIRRVLGGAHPLIGSAGRRLRDAQAVLRAREASSGTG